MLRGKLPESNTPPPGAQPASGQESEGNQWASSAKLLHQ
jgi:hypothetical protein